MRAPPLEPRVVFEDDCVLAVDKPAGVSVIPTRDEGEGCLRFTLERARRESLWVVHRIDRDTSGVVVFARNKDAHRTLSMAFERRLVEKRYVAFVRSEAQIEASERRITRSLHSARKSKMRPAVDGEEGALPSETIAVFSEGVRTNVGWVSRVEARPLTGRQHQIRVHLRWLGTPLLVDALYGGAPDRQHGALGEGSPSLDRLTLHAESLSVAHPTSGKALKLEAPLAADLDALEAWLQRFRGADRR
jgi:RluA family pseudouridine synthase